MTAIEEIEHIYHLPLTDLVYRAGQIHRKNFNPKEIQAGQLLSIKTGGCPENCSYCPQSAHYTTGVSKQAMMSHEEIVSSAKRAKANGATRFCMGTAWREVSDGPDFDHVVTAVEKVKREGLEVCCTLGMLSYPQAVRLKRAGLYAYNHNIDTSEKYYSKIISTRKFQDRIKTIGHVRRAGITVCTGGILGLGESSEDRISFLHTLANLTPHPESVTINTLVRIKGTPLEHNPAIDPSIIIRTIASARILMPQSIIRLSAGRMERTELEQFLCFYVGANSIFLGEKLLTSPNPETCQDKNMLEKFGLNLKAASCD